MKIQTANGEEVVKEAFWLAWQACQQPTGMGWMQHKPAATKEDVWKNVAEEGDYAYRMKEPEKGKAYGDYVFGRMMKLLLSWDETGVTFSETPPRSDYQAWCGTYPTLQLLVEKAIANVG
jgi:hypothetical protein